MGIPQLCFKVCAVRPSDKTCQDKGTCRTPLPACVIGNDGADLVWFHFTTARARIAPPAETLDFEHDSDRALELETFSLVCQVLGNALLLNELVSLGPSPRSALWRRY